MVTTHCSTGCSSGRLRKPTFNVTGQHHVGAHDDRRYAHGRAGFSNRCRRCCWRSARSTASHAATATAAGSNLHDLVRRCHGNDLARRHRPAGCERWASWWSRHYKPTACTLIVSGAAFSYPVAMASTGTNRRPARAYCRRCDHALQIKVRLADCRILPFVLRIKPILIDRPYNVT